MYDFIERIEIKSIPEQISEKFKAEILNGKLKPGEKLPSLEDLAERLLVSKPTIREALQPLIESGFVRVVKGRNGGYFVSELYPNKFVDSMYEMIKFSLSLNKFERTDLLEIRKIIEIPYAGIAAERRTEENVEDLNKVKQLIIDKSESSISDMLEVDLLFHISVAKCTQNPLAVTIINALNKSILDSEEIWGDDNKHFILANATDVIDAIIAKDVALAKKKAEEHMEGFLLVD